MTAGGYMRQEMISKKQQIEITGISAMIYWKYSTFLSSPLQEASIQIVKTWTKEQADKFLPELRRFEALLKTRAAMDLYKGTKYYAKTKELYNELSEASNAK